MPFMKATVEQLPDQPCLNVKKIMVKHHKETHVSESAFVAGKKCRFAGVNFSLPTDEDEWLCDPGMYHVETAAWLPRALQTHHSPLHALTWGRGRGALLQTSSSHSRGCRCTYVRASSHAHTSPCQGTQQTSSLQLQQQPLAPGTHTRMLTLYLSSSLE